MFVSVHGIGWKEEKNDHLAVTGLFSLQNTVTCIKDENKTGNWKVRQKKVEGSPLRVI